MTPHDDWDALIAATHEPLSPEEQAAVDRIVAAACWLEVEIEKARAYLAAIETGDDLLYALGEL